MSRARKVFDITVDEEKNPITVDLVFTRTAGGSETHSFKAMSDPGAGGAFAAATLVRYDDKGKQILDLNGIMAFFDRVLMDDGAKRLRTLCDRQDLTIPLETLTEVYGYILEEQTGRPTERSSTSVDGPQATGDSSTAPLSSVG